MSRPRFLRICPFAWLSAGVWLLASACGPGVATPMPEPPAAVFDLGGVDKGELPLNQPVPASDAMYITGAPGTVPSDASVRITNLDQTTLVFATTAAPDGSFLAIAVARAGDELRFEWTKDGRHSAPADGIALEPDALDRTIGVQPSARFDCVTLTPGYALDFSEGGSQRLELANECDAPLLLANARPRLNLSDFTLSQELPVTLEAGERIELLFDFTRSADGLREDVWFLDVTLEAETTRYPFTLRTE